MKESEWLSCADPEPMLEHLRRKCTASDRRLRLFAAACCRRIAGIFGHRTCIKAIEANERFADGFASLGEVEAAWDAADRAAWDFAGVVSQQVALGAIEVASRKLDAPKVVARVASAIRAAEHEGAWVPWEQRTAKGWEQMRARVSDAVASEAEAESRLLRDIFGNPFRPARIGPAWLTPTVISLAQAIYDERSFHRMPHLAELLEEAGCSDAGILGHCRSLAEHVRGCWVVDAALGKA